MKKNAVYKFNEVLTDDFGCLLLGDVYTLKQFQEENKLADNLQIPFTTTNVGDDVVQQGAVIYLGNVVEPYDVGYTVFFNFSNEKQIEKSPECRIIHNTNGYVIHVLNENICLYTWRYLAEFNQEIIDSLFKLCEQEGMSETKTKNGIEYLTQNPVRQMVSIENGWYEVQVIAGYLEEMSPAFEFIFTPTSKTSVGDNLEELISYDYSLS